MLINEKYIFHPIGEKVYDTVITLDPLSLDEKDCILVCCTQCNCKSHDIQKKECKHIIDTKKVLTKRGIKIRDCEMVRVFCPLCKKGKNVPKEEFQTYNQCGDCTTIMVVPKNGK